MGIEIDHQDMVRHLKKPGAKILQQMTDDKVDLTHMAMGVAGEAGELVDAIKKHAFYNKPLDLENVIEELGDLEFYMEGVRQILGISREETLAANTAKLLHGDKARYKNGYTDEAAIARSDKQ